MNLLLTLLFALLVGITVLQTISLNRMLTRIEAQVTKINKEVTK